MNKRALSIVAASALAVAALAAPASAAPAAKATGDVWADNPVHGAGMSHMVFNAQGTFGSAKGTFTYSDPDGSYTIAVQAVDVDGDVAWFAGPLVSNTHPAVRQSFGVVAVRDGGEPGIGVDAVSAEFYAELDLAKSQFGGLTPEKYGLVASAGNIQVH